MILRTLVITVCFSLAPALWASTYTSRLATYELEYVRSKASTARVDDILAECAIPYGFKVLRTDPPVTTEVLAKYDITQHHQLTTRVDTTTLSADDSGASDAVASLTRANPPANYAEYMHEVERALQRALRRQPWLQLLKGHGFDEAGQNVLHFFIVIDERNREYLIVADGDCPPED